MVEAPIEAAAAEGVSAGGGDGIPEEPQTEGALEVLLVQQGGVYQQRPLWGHRSTRGGGAATGHTWKVFF